MQDYLSGLNEKQKEAVLYLNGPLMIVAGAGSGKTKVLTTRIAHLMANGVDSFHILALTFTNKAAKEMRERVEKIGSEVEVVHVVFNNNRSDYAPQAAIRFRRVMGQSVPATGKPGSAKEQEQQTLDL